MKSSGETKLFAGILLVAVLLVGVALLPMVTGKKQAVIARPKIQFKVEDLIQRDSRIRGNPNAPYTLVEFGDYQCPMCMSADDELPKMLTEHADKLRYIFHYYQPITTHVHTRAMARAAEAAANQGKFWQMHTELFKAQTFFEDATTATAAKKIRDVAKTVKLDMLRFEEDLADPKTAARVQASQDHAAKLGIRSTPTFVIVPPHGNPVTIGALGELTVWLKEPKNLK